MAHVFGLDLDAADEFHALPVVEGQAAVRPHSQQEAGEDSCVCQRDTLRYTLLDTCTPCVCVCVPSHSRMKLTFSPKVWFQSLLLFKVLKDFDHTVAFPGGVPVDGVYTG